MIPTPYLDRTALIADDQLAVREDLRRILRRIGCRVAGEAATSDEALAKFEQLRPDLLIIDATLPGSLDPLLVIRRARRIEVGAVILVAGSISQSVVVMEALSMGASDFVLKPVRENHLRACLEGFDGIPSFDTL